MSISFGSSPEGTWLAFSLRCDRVKVLLNMGGVSLLLTATDNSHINYLIAKC